MDAERKLVVRSNDAWFYLRKQYGVSAPPTAAIAIIRAVVTASEQPPLQADAASLKSHPNIHLTIEGHCDELGSTEYDAALGENRAKSTLALVSISLIRSLLQH